MATHNIKDKIICAYKDECSKYRIWTDVKNENLSNCLNCKHNTYKEIKKKNYYKPTRDIIIGNFMFYGIAMLFIVLLISTVCIFGT